MKITSAQYIADPEGNNNVIKATIDGITNWVPNNSPANRHYSEIMRQVAAGELTIADAD